MGRKNGGAKDLRNQRGQKKKKMTGRERSREFNTEHWGGKYKEKQLLYELERDNYIRGSNVPAFDGFNLEIITRGGRQGN